MQLGKCWGRGTYTIVFTACRSLLSTLNTWCTYPHTIFWGRIYSHLINEEIGSESEQRETYIIIYWVPKAFHMLLSALNTWCIYPHTIFWGKICSNPINGKMGSERWTANKYGRQNSSFVLCCLSYRHEKMYPDVFQSVVTYTSSFDPWNSKNWTRQDWNPPYTVTGMYKGVSDLRKAI